VTSYDFQSTSISSTNPLTIFVSVVSISIRTSFLHTQFFLFLSRTSENRHSGPLVRVTDYTRTRITLLLACDAKSMCNRNLTFRGNELSSFSRVEYIYRTLKMRNASKCQDHFAHWRSLLAQKAESSANSLRKLEKPLHVTGCTSRLW
jgi:hypothetical protein